jgi:two-component system, OmpR family, copper resistance phosphate regulon response regulator CusR
MRILVVEDNPKMAHFIQQGLSEHGYVVDVAGTGREGEERATGGEYDLIILDVMLPDQDGLQTCRNLRLRKIARPVLMLTALSTTDDKVRGLDVGADDYLTKPFEFDELVARVRALLRRGQATESSRLRYADLEMDLLTRSVTRGGERIKLTAKEFALLECFLRSPERVLTRTAIAERVWDMNFDADSNVIDVYVSMLRRKIDKDYDTRLIQTIVGSGYMLSQERAED